MQGLRSARCACGWRHQGGPCEQQQRSHGAGPLWCARERIDPKRIGHSRALCLLMSKQSGRHSARRCLGHTGESSGPVLPSPNPPGVDCPCPCVTQTAA